MKKQFISEEIKSSLVLLNTLKAINQCKLEKEGDDKILHPLLNTAFNEIKNLKISDDIRNYVIEVFLRNLFFVFSLQRQHNIWQEYQIKSDVLGSQMRKSGRSIVRWFVNNMSNWLYQRDKDGFLYNLNLLVEYGNYDLLFHNEIQTKNKAGKTGKFGSKNNPNKIISYEQMNIPLDIIIELVIQNYRRNKGRSLIARWLPKYTTSTKRYTKLIVGKDIKRNNFDCTDKESVRLNGKLVKDKVEIKEGDIIIYSRRMQNETINRVKRDNNIVKLFCNKLGWNLKQYTQFRHDYMKLTPEHQFSSNNIIKFNKIGFKEWLNKLSSSQQYVVSSHLCFKDSLGKLSIKSDSKWSNTNLPNWYIEWFNEQTNVTEDIREAMSKGDTIKVKQLQKQVKVKTTGIQTIDLLTDIIAGKKTEQEINTLHTALISKMEMLVPVYTIIDGSASMNSTLSINNQRLSYLDIALTLAVTFMTTNPIEELKDSCMWFGEESTFTGVTKYNNNAPNSYLTGDKFIENTKQKKIINLSGTFTENFRKLHQANPQRVQCTNAGKVVTTFMNLVSKGQMNIESLPKVLLFLTDEEYNRGADPVQKDGKGFTQLPQSIGWNPLFVFWGLKSTSGLDRYKDAPNCMVTRGFSENNLSQILQFIKKGSISMYDELFAIHEMPGLSLINYK